MMNDERLLNELQFWKMGIHKWASMVHHWHMTAEVSILNWSKVYAEQSGELLKIRREAHADKMRHKSD